MERYKEGEKVEDGTLKREKRQRTFIFRSELIRFLLKESYNLDFKCNTLENS